jgi:hypothetical protein
MHTPSMRERPVHRRRVLIEDARRNGHHLRATWHPDTRQFVLSTWREDVCTGSARLAVEDAADLAGLLVDGLGEAAAVRSTPSVPTGRQGLGGLVDRLRWLVRGVPPGAASPESATPGAPGKSDDPGVAAVRPLRRRPA